MDQEFDAQKRELTEVYSSLYDKCGYQPSVYALKIKQSSLLKELDLHNPRKIIDFGAGHGLVVKFLRDMRRFVTVTGVDLIPGPGSWLVQSAWEKVPTAYDFAYSTDFLEHLPPETVEATIKNIVETAPHGFHSISTRPDTTSGLLGLPKPLHLTVQAGPWWKKQFERAGVTVTTYRHYEGRNVEIGY